MPDTTGLLVIAALLAALVLVVVARVQTASIQISLDLPMEDRHDLDQQLFDRLRGVGWARIKAASHESYVLTIRRLPAWAGLGAVVALFTPIPWAALALLCVRHDVDLHLNVVRGSRGTVLRVAGASEAHLWRRLSRILSPLVDLERQAHSSSETSRETASS